jgi:hypothetical protein
VRPPKFIDAWQLFCFLLPPRLRAGSGRRRAIVGAKRPACGFTTRASE